MCQWEGSNNAPTLADDSFDEVECIACTPSWLWVLAGILSVIMLLLGVKELLSTRADSAEDDELQLK